jgi:hypothetical protein
VKPILEVEVAVVLHDVSEKVTEESGILGQQGIEVESLFRGDELS